MLCDVDQAIASLACGRLKANGSAFELYDVFVRFRSLCEPVKLQGGESSVTGFTECSSFARHESRICSGRLAMPVAGSWR